MNDQATGTKHIPCAICGYEQWPEDLFECENPACGRKVCVGCHNECSEWHCHNDICDDCAYHCEYCDSRLCDECRYACEDCGDVLCEGCGYIDDDDCFRCRACHDEYRGDRCDPVYHSPYEGLPWETRAFTYGIEIEIDGPHDREPMKRNALIAGWCPDGSLDDDGSEYQTQPLAWNPDTLKAINRLIESIPDMGDRAGGHIHIKRTPRQSAARWYWALAGLTDQQAQALNMRHTSQDRWCRLTHGDYSGKTVAVNDRHDTTIELRTFGRWNHATAPKLTPALTWLHTMWRFFQNHPLYGLDHEDIRTMSHVAARNAIPRPLTPAENRRNATTNKESQACA
ncbi:hypothetical protein [Bifidobacterium simiarum]|uniref:hypothetical protein n=1 Tax=Bifidobacterium simiarum TaxID=2045441 RepID=UPI001BDC78A4|nr:hypothetical protein [Bifidobacterium simiarum]MBT1167263.1 hypothetical protein [Bifidobacterium simiarum]